MHSMQWTATNQLYSYEANIARIPPPCETTIQLSTLMIYVQWAAEFYNTPITVT